MNKGVAITTLAALAAGLCASPTAARDTPPVAAGARATGMAAPAATSTAADTPEADLALRPMDPRMGVDVLVDGAGSYRFLVDSGASRTVVSRALASRLGLKDAGKVDLHSVAGESEVDSVDIGKLELGGVTTHPIQAPVLDAGNIGGPAILGIDALEGKKVVIDLAAHRMTIAKSTRYVAPASDGEIVVTARRRFGQLILADADINGMRVDAVIDSGSEATIGNPALEARLTARSRAKAIPITVVDVAGRVADARLVDLPELHVGDLHLHNVPVAFTDAHAFHQFGLIDKPALLLGMDVLHAFRRVSIDFASRSVRFLVEDRGAVRLAAR